MFTSLDGNTHRGRRSLGGTTVPRRLRALLRRLAPPSIANEWGMCGALPPPAMHMMVAMHTTLLMATLVNLVEIAAMHISPF